MKTKIDPNATEAARKQRRMLMLRGYFVYILLVIFSGVVLTKVWHIQFFEGNRWQAQLEALTTDLRSIPATRGNIYGADGSLLATSIPVFEIRMDMQAEGLKDDVFNQGVDSLSICLANLFGDKTAAQYKQDLQTARREGKRYFLVHANVDYDKVKKAREFPIFRKGRFKGGVIFEKYTVRKHPLGNLAIRTIGYEKPGSQPVGLEGAFNVYLKGRPGSRYEKRLAGGIWMPISDHNVVDPQDGADVYSTIDPNIQDVANNALRTQLIKHSADHGCVVLMEVKTGFVRAIANLTRQDDGSYKEDYNYAVGEATEPGSTFKLASLMAALEDGKIKITDSIDIYHGRFRYYDRVMRDAGDHGQTLTVKQCFEKSSNVGVSRLIYNNYKNDPQQFVDRLNAMGLNEPLGLEIPGEGQPRIKNTTDPGWSGVSLPWMSIGYEVLETPMQILALYNSVANDGVLVRPQFVEEIKRGSQVIRKSEPIVLKSSICSKETLKSLRSMMEGVVQDHGTASNLMNSNYKIAGKTGTAQIANAKYGYKYDQEISYQASFVGYFPADNPMYSCIVVVNAPSNEVYYGNQVAGPIFKEISDKVYAQHYDLFKHHVPHTEIASVEIPISTNGNAHDLKTIYQHLKVPYTGNLQNAEWVHTSTSKDTVHIDNLSVHSGLVPNVLGMGLEDALYLLEKNGLKVKVNGYGTVQKQSLLPGSRLDGAQTITLDLS